MVIGTWPHWEHSPIEDVGTEMGTAPLLTAPFWGTAPLRTQGCGDRNGDSPTWGHSPTWGRSPIKDVGMGDQRWGQPCWGVQPHWGVTAPLGSGGQRRGCSPTGGTAPYGVAAPWGPPAGRRAPRLLTVLRYVVEDLRALVDACQGEGVLSFLGVVVSCLVVAFP